MDKQQILSFIKTQLANGAVSRQDVVGVLDPGSSVSEAPAVRSSRNLINVFYAIGAVIVLVGIIILIVQHWHDIGFAGRILVTLGISLATFIAGLLLKNPNQKMISQVMLTISAALAPLGSYILLDEAGINFDLTHQLIISLVLLIVFAFAQFVSKRNILVLIVTGFGTWLYFTVVFKLFDFTSVDVDLIKWAVMFAGFSYLLIAFGYGYRTVTGEQSDQRERSSVKGALYAIGTLAVLGAGISIDGMFDLVFIAFLFAAFYGSVFLKSRAMLTLAALFLMAHLIKLTSEYFVNSIGWPIALVACGFIIIAIGYATFYLNRKYISNP